MEVIQKTPEKLVLRMDANETLANAIRRSVSEVMTLAIGEVEIFKNDSALYDEYLAHRLGLVPLKTEKGMNLKTKVEAKIVKEGPCTVYSGDIKGNIEVIYDNIPLTVLSEGSSIELVATAVLGKGIDHAKNIPGLVYYRHLHEVKSNPEVDKIIQKNKGFIKPEKKGGSWICDINDSEYNEIIKLGKDIVKDSEEIILVVESYGMMDAKDILLKAIDSLEENLDSLEKQIKS